MTVLPTCRASHTGRSEKTVADLFCQFGCRRSGFVQGENGIIFGLNMSGEMHMRRRNEVFGCIPHGRGALFLDV